MKVGEAVVAVDTSADMVLFLDDAVMDQGALDAAQVAVVRGGLADLEALAVIFLGQVKLEQVDRQLVIRQDGRGVFGGQLESHSADEAKGGG